MAKSGPSIGTALNHRKTGSAAHFLEVKLDEAPPRGISAGMKNGPFLVPSKISTYASCGIAVVILYLGSFLLVHGQAFGDRVEDPVAGATV